MHKATVVLAGLWAAVLSMNVYAQTTDCDALGKTIEAQVMDLSSVDGTFDDSAPRETNRLLRKSIAMNEIQANLILMQAAKCRLPTQPISDRAYFTDATACELAATQSKAPVRECDRSKWVRDSMRPKIPAGANGLVPATDSALLRNGLGGTYTAIAGGASTYSEPSADAGPSQWLRQGEIVQVQERYQDFARISADGAPARWVKISSLARIQ
jgi:hypothetical protein